MRELIELVQQRPEPRGRLDLYVADELTLDGSSIDFAVGMAIVLDAALNEALFPRGFTQTDSGRVYHYQSEE